MNHYIIVVLMGRGLCAPIIPGVMLFAPGRVPPTQIGFGWMVRPREMYKNPYDGIDRYINNNQGTWLHYSG